MLYVVVCLSTIQQSRSVYFSQKFSHVVNHIFLEIIRKELIKIFQNNVKFIVFETTYAN